MYKGLNLTKIRLAEEEITLMADQKVELIKAGVIKYCPIGLLESIKGKIGNREYKPMVDNTLVENLINKEAERARIRNKDAPRKEGLGQRP